MASAEIEQRIRAEMNSLDEVTDALGLPLDSGVKRTVAALRLMGFETSGSCEGHLDRGTPTPWIDLAIPSSMTAARTAARLRERIKETEDWWSDPEAQALHGQLREKRRPEQGANRLMEERLRARLEAFNRGRQTVPEERLEISTLGANKEIRLASSYGHDLHPEIQGARRLVLNARGQAELAAFTDFLELRLEREHGLKLQDEVPDAGRPTLSSLDAPALAPARVQAWSRARPRPLGL